MNGNEPQPPAKDNQATSDNRGPEDVLFISRIRPAAGEANLHRDDGADALKRSLNDVKEDWTIVSYQVGEIISTTDSKVEESGFRLDEITIKLGFTAKGKIAFIAEAGIEASVEIKFKRQ